MSSSSVKCAPSKNLNTNFPHFPTAHELYVHLRSITQPGGEFVVRNFVAVVEDISPDASLVYVCMHARFTTSIWATLQCLNSQSHFGFCLSFLRLCCCSETELFPKGALLYYTKKNMGWEYTKKEADMWQLAERGGEQGDYRDGVSTLRPQIVFLCL